MSHSNENPLPQNPSEATEQQDGNDLINQFFIPNNNIRYNEIKFCLKKNVDNNKISEIHLLVEKIYTDQELGITSNKIKQILINKRYVSSRYLFR